MLNIIARMIRRYTGRYAETVPLGRSPIMTWPDFVARVEEQTRLDDSAKILDIDVTQPSFDRDLDLCALVGANTRSVMNWIFIKHPDYRRYGHLVIWKSRGELRMRGSRGLTSREEPKAVVLTPDSVLAPKSENKTLTWVELRTLVERHPDYNPEYWVNTVDIDACSADQVTVEVSNDWYKPSLIIRGEPAPELTSQQRLIQTMRQSKDKNPRPLTIDDLDIV
jgi:hypothetical protein